MTLTEETAAERKFIGNRAEGSQETNFDFVLEEKLVQGYSTGHTARDLKTKGLSISAKCY